MGKGKGMFDGSDSESSGDEATAGGLSINKAYAAKYEIGKRKQELSVLRDREKARKLLRMNSLYDDGESSTSESEDEHGELLTESVDRDIFKTLAALRAKDPSIYEKDAKFYHSDEDDTSKPVAAVRLGGGGGGGSGGGGGGGGGGVAMSKKKYTLQDMERDQIVAKIKAGEEAYSDDDSSSDDDSDSDGSEGKAASAGLSHVEEQRKLKQEVLRAVHGGDEEEEEEEEGGGLFTKRVKSKAEEAAEDAKYADLDARVRREMARKFYGEQELSKEDAFLRDYVLNEGWVEEKDRVPTYDEVVGDLEDLENELEAERVEAAHNFRFEEQDSAQVHSYPRTIAGTVRRKDDRRAVARRAREERKKAEKERKKEELNRLKNLKKAEIMDRLKKIKEVSGTDSLPFGDDLGEDFDPSAHDRMMQQMFDEQYYEHDDNEKPVFSDMSDMEGDTYADDGAEDGADAQYGGAMYDEHGDAVTARGLHREFEQGHIDESQLMEKLHALEYEDIVGGDIPVRFKWRRVKPETGGLSVEEILQMDDSELNQRAPLKRLMSTYWDNSWEVEQARAKERMRKNARRKRKRAAKRAAKEAAAAEGAEEEEEVVEKVVEKQAKRRRVEAVEEKEEKVEKVEEESAADKAARKAARKAAKKAKKAAAKEAKKAAEKAAKKARKEKKRRKKDGMTKYGVTKSRLASFKTKTPAYVKARE